ncbi:MAG: kelch repeat-containing protein [Novipirellula sp. JB048]
MIQTLTPYRVLAILAVWMTCTPGAALAHFPWLILNQDGKPVLFFGEDLSDRTYHLPKSLAAFPLAQITGDSKTKSLKMQPVESDTLVGLVATESIDAEGCIVGTQTYGNYHGTKLVYFVQHCLGNDPANWQSTPREKGLHAKIEEQDGGVCVTVLWNQKPLADVDLKLSSEDGQEQGAATTDAEGRVTFSGSQVSTGLNAIMVGFTDTSASGTFNGESYASTTNYLTATFNGTSDATRVADPAKNNAGHEVQVIASQLPDLPTELTSFGGAIADGKLYVYGGHIGAAHSYSTAEQSDALWSLDLKHPNAWQPLPSGPRLQGLAMVAHDRAVVRFGGFTAKNAEGEEHDLHSQASVARFDASTNQWIELTKLPEPRSSHAAVIVDDQVYVVGGWSMSGDGQTQWHATAWTANLSQKPIAWKEIAAPPFQRRALALASYDGKVFVIGGMSQEGGPTTRVDIYDPKTNQWSQGPSLQGEPMTGFGCWAGSLGGSLYTSTVSGTIQKLSANGKQWQIVGTYEPGRFFHCMLPVDESKFVMVGGANMSVGRFTNLDWVRIKPPAAKN